MEINVILILSAICWTDSWGDTQTTHIWHQPHWFNDFFISWMRLLQTRTSLTLSTSTTTIVVQRVECGAQTGLHQCSNSTFILIILDGLSVPLRLLVSLSQGKWPSRQTSTTGGRKMNNQWIAFTHKLHLRKSKPCLGIWVITCRHKANAMTLAISACRREV